jgi:hypothetical protein
VRPRPGAVRIEDADLASVGGGVLAMDPLQRGEYLGVGHVGVAQVQVVVSAHRAQTNPEAAMAMQARTD